VAATLSKQQTVDGLSGTFKTVIDEIIKQHPTFQFFETTAPLPSSDRKLLDIKVRLDDLRALDSSSLSWAEMTTWKSKKVVEIFVVSQAPTAGHESVDVDKQGKSIFYKNGTKLVGFDHPMKLPLKDRYHKSGAKKGQEKDPKKMPGYRIRFIETRKTEGAASGASTEMQEIGSAYIFTQTLIKKNNKFKDYEDFKSEVAKGKKGVFKDLVKYYPVLFDKSGNLLDKSNDWILNYYKQYKKILDVFSKKDLTGFDHGAKFSPARPMGKNFMDWITDKVTENFGYSKKDNWNPADIWAVSKPVSKIKAKLERAVFTGRDSETVEQLNATLRGMWHAGEIYGISLKKVSGGKNAPADWEVYNLEKMTLEQQADYMYPNIDITCQLIKEMSTDSIVMCKDNTGKGYKFQIRPNSRGFSNLKFESTKLGSTKARGGKAAVDQVEQLLKDNRRNTFINAHQEYPQNKSEFDGTLKGTGKCCFTIDTWQKMFKVLINNDVHTGVTDVDYIIQNIKDFYDKDVPEAISKLMQVTFLVNALGIKKNAPAKSGRNPEVQYQEFWMDMVFLSIKKGDKFGPFGKLF